MKRAWIWVMGELPEFPVDSRDSRVLWWVGILASLAFILGEFHLVQGDPLVKGVWRLACHGSLAFSGIALVCAMRERCLRGLAFGSMALVLAPLIYRVVVTGGGKLLIRNPLGLVLPVLLGSLGALWVLRRCREPLSDWGISWGDWRWWSPRVAIATGLILPCAWLALSLSPELASHYPTWKPARSDASALMLQQLCYGLELWGWEFLLRGVLLFYVARRGDAHLAIWLQCLPFVLLHFDKPALELYLSLPGGLLAGWFCLRARSFFPLFLLHWVQLASVGVMGFVLR